MEWIKEASHERFEELKQIAKNWVKDKKADPEFIAEVEKAKTLMELRRVFNLYELEKEFEDMMIEFFR